MGDSTDRLLELAARVSSSPHPREQDMLLSAGERISIALLSMAIIDLGREAISFTGSQAGIVTDRATAGRGSSSSTRPGSPGALRSPAGRVDVAAEVVLAPRGLDATALEPARRDYATRRRRTNSSGHRIAQFAGRSNKRTHTG
jgi:hypothetical protein